MGAIEGIPGHYEASQEPNNNSEERAVRTDGVVKESFWLPRPSSLRADGCNLTEGRQRAYCGLPSHEGVRERQGVRDLQGTYTLVTSGKWRRGLPS